MVAGGIWRRDLVFFISGLLGAPLFVGMMYLAVQIRHAPWLYFCLWMLGWLAFSRSDPEAAKQALIGVCAGMCLLIIAAFWYLLPTGLLMD